MPDNIPGQELCSSVTAPVPKWSIGRPSLLDRLHPKSSEWNTYLSEPAYDTFFCSLHGRIAVASFDKIVGGVSITMHDDARLWTTVREARRVDLECENLEKFDMLTMSHLMPYDLPCWAPKSLELEAIPAVASILRADKFRLENDISEEERPDRRRVTRASRQKRRYFLDLLDEDEIATLLGTRDSLINNCP